MFKFSQDYQKMHMKKVLLGVAIGMISVFLTVKSVSAEVTQVVRYVDVSSFDSATKTELRALIMQIAELEAMLDELNGNSAYTDKDIYQKYIPELY